MGLFDLAELLASGKLFRQSIIQSIMVLQLVSPKLTHPLLKFQPRALLQPRWRQEFRSGAPPWKSVFHHRTNHRSNKWSMRPRACRAKRLSVMDAVISMMAQRCMVSGNGLSRQRITPSLLRPTMQFVVRTWMPRLLLLALGMPATMPNAQPARMGGPLEPYTTVSYYETTDLNCKISYEIPAYILPEIIRAFSILLLICLFEHIETLHTHFS